MLLPAEYSLGGGEIVETVVGANYHHVVVPSALGHRGGRRLGLWHGYAKVVVFRFRIRQLANRLDELPVVAIERIRCALDRRKRIAGAEADVDLRADLRGGLLSGLPVIATSIQSGRQVLDDRGRGIDLETCADTFGVEGFSGRMRRRIGGNDLHRVAAVGQKTGVERIVAIGEVRLQQQPARFAVAAVIHAVDELVVVVVMCLPANSNRVEIAHGGRWWIEARLSLSL